MRIANNIMAMNTHRAYTNNNDKIAASAEKLSSGYRINKAGDDAAGLAISEKMRAQIRGLNMAKRNSQDAISLIQTAEGALQEVHAMLQRMNELAVQSATGTNETFDRTQIAKEFEQLKREINDISEQTTFNNMSILDGSLSADGVRDNRSAYTSGIYTQFEKVDPTTGAGGLKDITLTEGTPYIKGYSATFTVDLAGMKITDATGGQTVGIKIGGQEINSTDTTLTSLSTSEDIAKAIAEGAASGVTINGNVYSVISEGSKLAFTYNASATGQASYADIDAKDLKELVITDFLYNGAPGAGVTGASYTGVVNATDGKADVKATKAQASFVYDWTSAKSGDSFTVGTNEILFYNSDLGDAENAKNGIDLAKITSASDFASHLGNLLKDGELRADSNKCAVEAVGNKIVITFDGKVGSAEGNNTFGTGEYGVKGNQWVKVDSKPKEPDAEGKTNFEIDMDKLKVGDIVTWKSDDGTTYKYTITTQSTVKDMAERFGIKEFDGNSWTVEGAKDQSDRIGFTAAQDYTEYDVMKIQIGALEGEQLSIKIAAMNTKGLELDDATIYDQKLAGAAITSTRNAINEVSDQRARLGAMQNRMNHKINTLAISAENLQAAESRIRDVDIAQEMTSFTQANILSQAATAMLAQANSAPQNVLSLLK